MLNAANMPWRGRALALAILVGIGGLLLPPGSAASTDIPLRGGRIGRVRGSGARASALFKFSDETGLAALGDPRCPATSSVRVDSRAGDYRVAVLSCEKWRATSTGFVYDDLNAADGVRRLALRPDGVQMLLRAGPMAQIAGPATHLDVSLRVGATRACGRFERFSRNRAGHITAAAGTVPCTPPRPNVLVINLDDTRADGIDRMPVLQSRVIGQGVKFTNAFVPNSLCCPSRASLFTGLYALHHGTRTLTLPIGGATSFRLSGADRQTIATWMHGADYRTGLFGKYLNAYWGAEATAGPGHTFYVPPGWDRWRAMAYGEHYGGINGPTYSLADEHGAVTVYDDHTTDAQYSTDLLAGEIRTFVDETVRAGKNFFVVFTPYASHTDKPPGVVPVPAERHRGVFHDIPPWRPASYAEADVSDKPLWLQALPQAVYVDLNDEIRRRAYETLLAVDEQLAGFLDQFDALGIGDDTLVIVTSDNGVSWGEHRAYYQGKQCPYEQTIRVPMAVRYPRRVSTTPASIAAPVLNLDVPVTVADLTGVPIPVPVDGAAFSPWLKGETPPAWRDDFLLEHWQGGRNTVLTWTAQPLDGDRLRLLTGVSVPLPRPEQAFEFDAGDGVGPGAIAVPIGVDAAATYDALGAAVRAALPNMTYTVDATAQQLILVDQSPGYLVAQWLEDVDQAGGFQPTYDLYDYLGVRDTANQYTYVEYGTGEVELYDLTVDPDELDNRANDPAYLGERLRLAARLREIVQ